MGDVISHRLRQKSAEMQADEELELAREQMLAERAAAEQRVRESLERQTREAGELGARRAQARAEFEERVTEAREILETRTYFARQARTKATIARNTVTQYRREHRARASRVHAAIDATSAAAERELRAQLGAHAPQLVLGLEAGVLKSAPLTELAGLHVASSNEFRARMHELVDGGAIPAGSGLSAVTDEEFDRRVAELQAEQRAAETVAARAEAAAAEAGQQLRRIEEGR